METRPHTYSPSSALVPDIVVIERQDADSIQTFRVLASELLQEYGFDLSYQNVDEELLGLPGLYAQPRGATLLAFVGGEAAGCVALRPLEQDVCEMKRLYVRPKFRFLGVGEKLCEHLLESARRIGYRAMRLDTRRSQMRAAINLYGRLGFYEIPPYNVSPFSDICYMEKRLDEA
jgi:ribosomal protein S18 acetylase RimI-like enzyme